MTLQSPSSFHDLKADNQKYTERNIYKLYTITIKKTSSTMLFMQAYFLLMLWSEERRAEVCKNLKLLLSHHGSPLNESSKNENSCLLPPGIEPQPSQT